MLNISTKQNLLIKNIENVPAIYYWPLLKSNLHVRSNRVIKKKNRSISRLFLFFSPIDDDRKKMKPKKNVHCDGFGSFYCTQ